MEISRCGAIGMREALRARRFGRKMMQIKYRDVAQLVARLVWDQDVAGSNPVIPTNVTDLTAFCGQIGVNLIILSPEVVYRSTVMPD